MKHPQGPFLTKFLNILIFEVKFHLIFELNIYPKIIFFKLHCNTFALILVLKSSPNFNSEMILGMY